MKNKEKGKQGKYIGAIVGVTIGVLILFPKVIWLILLAVIGYFVGGLFERKGESE